MNGKKAKQIRKLVRYTRNAVPPVEQKYVGMHIPAIGFTRMPLTFEHDAGGLRRLYKNMKLAYAKGQLVL